MNYYLLFGTAIVSILPVLFIKQYIKNNFMLDKNDPSYPTIDHKISIFFGFINKISVEEISRIENLCLTKRILNLKKNHKLFDR